MKTCNLSGMSEGYEELCQRMLWRGVAYLAEVKPPVEMWQPAKTSPQVYGIMLTAGEELKGLEEAIIKPGEGATGAMHQCVMGHLAYIHNHGTDAWLEKLAEVRPPEDFFEWNEVL